MPVQPVHATPYNLLILQYCPSRINQYGSTQSEPKQGFCFVWVDARERNQLPRLLQEDFEQVLQRPIETTPFLRTWPVHVVSMGPALVANSLFRGQERRTMRE